MLVMDECIINKVSFVGYLNSCLLRWVEIGVDNYIRDIIFYGYKIFFKIILESVELKNNRFLLENVEFVLLEIEFLLVKNCILEVSIKLSVVNLFIVVYNRLGKFRLVLDCRYVNFYLYKYRYRYEDVEVVRDVFDIGDFVFIFDFKLVYYYIFIFVEYR